MFISYMFINYILFGILFGIISIFVFNDKEIFLWIIIFWLPVLVILFIWIISDLCNTLYNRIKL